MRRLPAVLALTVVTACTGAETATELSASSRPPAVAAEAPTTTTTTVPTTTARLPPTTTTLPPTTTTTTLDRSLTADRLAFDLEALAGVREAGTEAEQAAAEYLEAELTRRADEVLTGAVPLPNGRTSRNVWATFGSGERTVLLGAHYDTKPPSPGADDNTSGTVVLLELARRLAGSPPSDLSVTIVFFGAEEILIGYDRNSHHFGSRLMADRLEADDALPDLMVSVDMVGVGERVLAVTYGETDPDAVELLAEAAQIVGVELIRAARGDISDHEAFARKGVPSAFLWRPDNPDYHRESDTTVRMDALLDDLNLLETFLELAAGR
jgi:Zn-dependent M28 family amino/carboxypeptidase